jgi:hypothetical protein
MVLIFSDSGWKYLGSPAFKLDEPLPEDEDSLDDVLWW